MITLKPLHSYYNNNIITRSLGRVKKILFFIISRLMGKIIINKLEYTDIFFILGHPIIHISRRYIMLLTVLPFWWIVNTFYIRKRNFWAAKCRPRYRTDPLGPLEIFGQPNAVQKLFGWPVATLKIIFPTIRRIISILIIIINNFIRKKKSLQSIWCTNKNIVHW